MKRVHVTIGIDITTDSDLSDSAIKESFTADARHNLCASGNERDSVTVTVERLDP